MANKLFIPYQYIARLVPALIFKIGSWDKLIYNQKIGFAINHCTVWIDAKNELLEILFFNNEGHCHTTFYLIPKTPEELVKRLYNECGEILRITLNSCGEKLLN